MSSNTLGKKASACRIHGPANEDLCALHDLNNKTHLLIQIVLQITVSGYKSAAWRGVGVKLGLQ